MKLSWYWSLRGPNFADTKKQILHQFTRAGQNLFVNHECFLGQTDEKAIRSESTGSRFCNWLSDHSLITFKFTIMDAFTDRKKVLLQWMFGQMWVNIVVIIGIMLFLCPLTSRAALCYLEHPPLKYSRNVHYASAPKSVSTVTSLVKYLCTGMM